MDKKIGTLFVHFESRVRRKFMRLLFSFQNNSLYFQIMFTLSCICVTYVLFIFLHLFILNEDMHSKQPASFHEKDPAKWNVDDYIAWLFYIEDVIDTKKEIGMKVFCASQGC